MRLLWMLCLWASLACAQGDILPQYNGDDLVTRLATAYRPSGLLSYNEARDTMYSKVYRDTDGNVTCLYTGHTIFLPPDVDPSAFLYNNSDLNGITAEHLYPQSKGAGEGDARSDMHSLVPAIWRVNEARSNYPFGEVPDDETDHWYAYTEDLEEIPTTDIDNYSERLNGGFGNPGRFEPRETVKGDVARAVFYFYTMYKKEADDADPDYFYEMKDILFEWHQQDPVDSLEYVLNFEKAKYQQGKLNPYILDCTLVKRAYFADSGIEVDCSKDFTLSTDKENSASQLVAYPNPVMDLLYLENTTQGRQYYKLTSTTGQQVLSGALGSNYIIDLSSIPAGTYILHLANAQGQTLNTKMITKQ